MKKLVLILLILFASIASAVELDGRTVILLVSAHRSGDQRMEEVKKKLLEERSALGLDTESMPIVFMGFKDSDTEREYFDRLGFQEFDSPVLCVVEWGNPARFGPKRVLDYAIARSATPFHVDEIVRNYLAVKDLPPGETLTQPPVSPHASGGLEIETVRFEAGGHPHYLMNTAVRLRNSGASTVRDIDVRFYCKVEETAPWQLIGKKPLDKLVSGYIASREIVGDSRQAGLTDENGFVRPCLYRIEVESGGNIIYQEGEFIPNQDPTEP
ncbi:MAG: hypothetical protein WC314_20290 [Vulcanimicrobiota bacterium]